MITVVSSIPAIRPQREIDGEDVSDAYRNACISSWGVFGTAVISVNSRSEAELFETRHEKFDIETVDSDGSAVCGKPLVLFDDLIAAAEKCGSEIIAFINSDIYLHDAAGLANRASQLKPGTAMVGRRANVRSLHTAQGSVYRMGYDLFVLHREKLPLLRSGLKLYFGEPWWDYHALCALMLGNVEVSPIDSAQALHLVHQSGFSRERWAMVGNATIRRLHKMARPGWFHWPRKAGNPTAELIHAFMAQNRALGQSLHGRVTGKLLGRPEPSLSPSAMDDFSVKLVRHAEATIGFEVSITDESRMATALEQLSRSLKES